VEVEVVKDMQPGPVGEVQEREINGKKFNLGTSLGKELEDKIANVISVNMDAFTWSSADMPGIDPNFMFQWLTMDERVKPVVQRRRNFNEDKSLVIREETQKLLFAGHVREIQYHEWLANVVLVKKANGKWRMCVNFTDLHKACSKDSYPLPSIDSLVDNASSCRLLSFLDAFSGYNQIPMHPKDESKTVFMAEFASTATRSCPLALRMLAPPIKG